MIITLPWSTEDHVLEYCDVGKPFWRLLVNKFRRQFSFAIAGILLFISGSVRLIEASYHYFMMIFLSKKRLRNEHIELAQFPYDVDLVKCVLFSDSTSIFSKE
uniref:Uncharacterized protein n=1 Tax=Glossina pallidipes TaxID=7398 RepID=A0A1A9Z6Y9_GLOPL